LDIINQILDVVLGIFLASPQFEELLAGEENLELIDGTIRILTSGAFDDPHFKTWHGDWYDYMGACDLKLLRAPEFDDGKALDIDIRTKIRMDYSFIESAALKIGDDVLEVSSWGQYYVNGVEGAEMPATISGFPVTHNAPTKKIHIFEVEVSRGEKIVLKTFKDMVSVKMENADGIRYLKSGGMMGDYNSGRMVARDGKTIISSPDVLASEWQIRQNEPMLFNTVKGPQHPEKCILPDPTAKQGRRLGESLAITAAEEACANAENKAGCVHDVLATGDLDLASAGAF
jgi:hypothetical protein